MFNRWNALLLLGLVFSPCWVFSGLPDTKMDRLPHFISQINASSEIDVSSDNSVLGTHLIQNEENQEVARGRDWTWDWIVILAYLIGTITFGLWVSRKQDDLEDYFLGGRNIPWGAALLSMIATEISAATFLGAPEQGYLRDLTYLQFGIGSIFARIALAFLFLGIFYRLKVFTVYGFLSHRFGFPTKNCAAGSFLLGRFFAGGSRLFIASLAVKVVTGMDFTYSIILLGSISIFYTLFGGIKAVIWTDVIQAIILVTGAILSIVVLMSDISLPVSEIFSTLSEHGKLRLFDFSGVDSSGQLAMFSNPYHFFPAIVGGFFLTMATHGTDQAMIQRLLTCKDSFRGKLSLVLSGFLGLIVAALFIFIGMLLFVYTLNLGEGDTMKQIAVHLRQTGQNGNLYLYYILEQIPPGVAGLIIASVIASAMSSIDSELNAMSSTFVNDFYTPYFKPKADHSHLMKIAKLGTLGFGAIVIFIAVLIAQFYLNNPETDLLTIALGVMTLFYGGLLGVFLVGLLTKKRGNSWSNISAMILSLLVIVLVTNKASLIPALGLHSVGAETTGFWSWMFHFKLAWPWFIVVGTAITVAISVTGMTTNKVLERFKNLNENQ